jgi:hypothetical protein
VSVSVIVVYDGMVLVILLVTYAVVPGSVFVTVVVWVIGVGCVFVHSIGGQGTRVGTSQAEVFVA